MTAFLRDIPPPMWDWGPAIVVLIMMFILALLGGRGLAKLLREAIQFAVPVTEKFIKAQERQADAMSKQAESMMSQATSMKDLSACIQAQRDSDHFIFEEVEKMVLIMKVVRNETADMKEAVMKLDAKLENKHVE